MATHAYTRDLGHVTLSRKTITAGSTVNLRLTYTAGRFGIDDSGGILVIERFASDSAPLQFDDPNAPNYVGLRCSNPAVRFSMRWGAKISLRPWGRGFEARITGGYLGPGDRIRVDYRNWRVQTFCERRKRIKVLSDPFATFDYAEVPRQPTVEVTAGPAARLVVVAPSRVAAGERFAVGVKIEDEWGNPCRQLASTVSVHAKGGVSGLPSKVRLRRGAARIAGLCAAKEGVTEVAATCGKLSARSNPVRIGPAQSVGRYWGDLHAQSEETIGTGSVEDYFAFARDYAFLDIAGHQGNDFQITRAFWERLNATTRRFNRGGRFVAFPGFEWSGNTGMGGDRNVIHRNEGGPLHRSSHALVEDASDIKTDANTVPVLLRKLRGKDSLVFAHVGGRFANMEMHDDAVERAVEVHSAWGTFEWLLFDSLKRGYRVGVVCNSDGHKCRPGASYPGAAKFGSYGGLTCVLADSLSRDAVFEALFARHCYGTTGARIDVDVRLCDAVGNCRAMMGDVVRATRPGEDVLSVSVLGAGALERVEIYNGSRRTAVRRPRPAPGARMGVKILTAGSESRGRARHVEWRGTLRVPGATIRRFEQVNFLNPEQQLRRTSANEMAWDGITTGAVQGAILYLDKQRGTIRFETDRLGVRVKIEDLTARPKVFRAGGVDARVEVYRVPPKNAPRRLDFVLPLKNLRSGDNPVFVKVVQRDGHMAWSSPMFIEKS